MAKMLVCVMISMRALTTQLRSLELGIGARLLALAFLLGPLGCPALRAETIPTSYHRPVQVELVNYLDVRHLHAGSSFFVKVANDWAGLGCYFRTGQLLEAKVEAASRRGKPSSPSQLAVSFANVPCVYNNSTIDLVLAAAVWNSGESNLPHAQFPIVRYSAMQTGSVTTMQGSFMVNGIDMMALNGKPGNHSPLKPGDVVGIRGVTLRIGAGPGKSSVLESSTRNVWIEKESVFLLVPASVAFLQPSSPDARVELSTEKPAVTELAEVHSGATAPDTPPAATAALPPRQEFLPCEPPDCSVDLPSTSNDRSGPASQSIAMGPLGYAPRPQREIDDLKNDDAVGWLGSHQLIVAFNPHPLVPRERAGPTGDTVRRIHAVVLDLSSQKVVSSADWDLQDQEAYLWQLSDNRLLVHVGTELRVLSEGMNVEKRVPLDGPLAFVRISPNGDWIAVAVIHERHSPELHAKLREALGRGPDEDVQIRILDKNFQTVAQATSSLAIMPPILLNEGQVQLVVTAEKHYRLLMLPWQGDSVSLASFQSSCLPSVSSFAPDLLFVATCAPLSGTHDYRVLRPNGVVLMHGRSDPQDLGPAVLGNGQTFAVKILHSTRAVVEGSVFHGSDLDYTEVRLYRSEDGRRITAIHLGTPPPSRGGFALSSDGSQLAILSGSKLNLFSLPFSSALQTQR